ncbi:MAG: bacteriohemerythrin [Burkholderiales bacterium]|nr:bacteriohemerythrin [Burkholderiales bacterium]
MSFHDLISDRETLLHRLSELMEQHRYSGKFIGLLLFDLDGYGVIREKFGEQAGDSLLKLMTERLRLSIRDQDFNARFGGDTFAALLPEHESVRTVAFAAERIRKKLAQPLRLAEGGGLVVGISMGVAIYPENAGEADRLLTVAESAMYDSKTSGRNMCTIYRGASRERADILPLAIRGEEAMTGIAELDDQHRELAERVNDLYDLMRIDPENRPKAEAMYDELVRFTEFHFHNESRMMGEAAYPMAEAHDREHRFLLEELRALESRIVAGVELHSFRMLKDWLVDHIEKADVPMGQYLTK